MKITVSLPEKLPVSDIEVCSIVGNLFDNAINAVRFGIVASNSFSGTVKLDGDRYLSTHPDGSGIGLTSVASIAERYNGTATFRHEGKEFFSGVMIPMKGEETRQHSPGRRRRAPIQR